MAPKPSLPFGITPPLPRPPNRCDYNTGHGRSSATTLILLSYRGVPRDALLIVGTRQSGREMKMSNIESARAASSPFALAPLLQLPRSSRAPLHTLRPRARSSPPALAARRSRAPTSLARPALPAPSSLPSSLPPHRSSLALEPAFQALTRRRALRNVGRCDRPVRRRLPLRNASSEEHY